MKYASIESKIENNVSSLRILLKRGQNIWLANALNKSMARAFTREVRRTIYAQIEFITADRIAQITKRLTKFNYEYMDAVIAIFIENGFSKYMTREQIDRYLQWAGVEGGQMLYDKVGVKGVFDLKDPDLIRILGERTNYIIDTVDKTTKEWIVNQIQNGVDKGLSNREIAINISSKGKDIALWRAELITHAETANAMNTVEHKQMKTMGYTKKRWITSGDDRVTPECRANERLGEVPIDYRYGSEGVLYPPRFSRCRCYHEPVIESRLPFKL